jgi:hypothetical protein
MKRCLVVLFATAAFLVGAQAYAHHSFAATYLEDKTVTIEGDLVQFMFRNPHSWVHVMVKEKDGKMVRYAVEWGGAGQLGGQGVDRDTLKIGDHVIISGNPARNASQHQVRMLALHRTKDGFGWGKKPGEVVD